VSPLWRDEIVIQLAPRKLVLARRARGIRSRVTAAAELMVQTETRGEVGPVLARLAEALSEPTWHGAAARAVVADHSWVRYAIVPWPANRLDAAGRLAHARYVLADVHGGEVADWEVTLADTPPGRPRVACAMPATLRSALQDALAPAHVDLVSLQPRLVVAFNAWRHRLPADDAWFVTLDAGWLSAAHLSDGAWDRVHMARLSPDWRVELERLQAFGRLTRVAGAPERIFVHAPDSMRRDGAVSPGLEWLERRAGQRAEAHELAWLDGGQG
jgi:hypothetical protein